MRRAVKAGGTLFLLSKWTLLPYSYRLLRVADEFCHEPLCLEIRVWGRVNGGLWVYICKDGLGVCKEATPGISC